MAIKNVVIPWLSGAALLTGYAAFAWVRGRRRPESTLIQRASSDSDEVAPLSERLEPLEPLERASEDSATASELPKHDHNSGARHADLGARFLGRASSALSPFQSAANRGPQLAASARRPT